ncbi:MAG: sel1 repeat family protein [Rudaea sp.]
MRGRICKLVAAAVMLGLGVMAHAEDDPLNDPEIQNTLRGMANASTWFHPDLFGEFAGMRSYAHHHYQEALKYFEIGALYADKMSQLSLGLMHMNGEGTAKDPVTAYAWLDLAAERDYPDFVATRDSLAKTLTPEQLAQGKSLRKTLGEKYADAVAKPRLATQLHLGQMQMTGSRTGHDSGIYQLKTTPSCGPTLVVGGQVQPQAGCGGPIFAKERWDPKLYFASRDREYKASVSVGAVEEAGKTIDKPPAQPAASAGNGNDEGAKPPQH